jgi:hypothetical protein
MLPRLIDFLKQKQITALMTTLTGGAAAQEQTEVNISSLVDTWLLLRDIESDGERNRGLYILKSRGAAAHLTRANKVGAVGTGPGENGKEPGYERGDSGRECKKCKSE